jgi:hypothetical protein
MAEQVNVFGDVWGEVFGDVWIGAPAVIDPSGIVICAWDHIEFDVVASDHTSLDVTADDTITLDVTAQDRVERCEQ